jgi:predicted KAP-like P-loop ATPase
MSSLEKSPSLSLGSDTPKTSPSDDAYGYAAFAEQIAEAILKTPSPNGLVMAINGQWGIGKSTLLNFIKHQLNSKRTVQEQNLVKKVWFRFFPRQSDEEQVLTIDFNPWWFSDKDHLAAQFTASFMSALKLEPTAVRKLGDLMAKYSTGLATTATTSMGVPWALKPVAAFLSWFKIKKEELPQLKKNIAKALKDSNFRVLFVIDDIDRLTPDEIREVFKVIKALADFPNVIYLLSFDRDVVASALGTSLKINGASYLEKIVQVPFTLPLIDKPRLRKHLFDNLNDLLGAFSNTRFEKVHWENVYFDGIDRLIEKPRDVVRLTNALFVSYPALAGEVNAVDFIAMEAIRVFEPILYEAIRNNREHYGGHAKQNRDIEEPVRKFHDSVLEKLPVDRRQIAKSIVTRLFPKAASAWGDAGTGSDWLATWRGDLRVCSPDLFDIYFQFGVPPEVIRRAELNRVVELASTDHLGLVQLLQESATVFRLDGSSKAGGYLERLRDLDREISPPVATGLLRALFEVGDVILSLGDAGRGFFQAPIHWRLIGIVNHFLAHVDEVDRHRTLRELVSNGTAIGLCVFTVDRFRQYLDKPSESPGSAFSSMGETEYADVQAIVNDRLARMTTDEFLALNDLAMASFAWRRWGGPDQIRGKLQPAFDRADACPILLDKFKQVGSSQVMGDPGVKLVVSMSAKSLADLVDISRFHSNVSKALASGTLTQDQQLAAESFLKSVERIANGESDDPFFDNESD